MEEANAGGRGNHNQTDEFEFERMMQQVLKDSKDEYDIHERKLKDEELQMIS